MTGHFSLCQVDDSHGGDNFRSENGGRGEAAANTKRFEVGNRELMGRCVKILKKKYFRLGLAIKV